MLTLDKLRAIAPKAANFPSLIEACEAYGIDTPLRIAHFLAQCAHESGGFARTLENLNYSGDALCAVWPSRFRKPLPGERTDILEFSDGKANALFYHRKPELIANRVYANRMGNGPESSGDGWRMRGHGLIQLTGTDNIRAFSNRYYGDDRLVDDPSPIASEPLAAYAAADFWREARCNAPADRDDIVAVTKAINGGTHGLEDRRKWLEKTKAVLL